MSSSVLVLMELFPDKLQFGLNWKKVPAVISIKLKRTENVDCLITVININATATSVDPRDWDILGPLLQSFIRGSGTAPSTPSSGHCGSSSWTRWTTFFFCHLGSWCWWPVSIVKSVPKYLTRTRKSSSNGRKPRKSTGSWDQWQMLRAGLTSPGMTVPDVRREASSVGLQWRSIVRTQTTSL